MTQWSWVKFPAAVANSEMGDHLWAGKLPQYFTEPPMPTQPPTLSGTGNKYQHSDALWLGSKGRMAHSIYLFLTLCFLGSDWRLTFLVLLLTFVDYCLLLMTVVMHLCSACNRHTINFYMMMIMINRKSHAAYRLTPIPVTLKVSLAAGNLSNSHTSGNTTCINYDVFTHES